jgi:hypothetical protein
MRRQPIHRHRLLATTRQPSSRRTIKPAPSISSPTDRLYATTEQPESLLSCTDLNTSNALNKSGRGERTATSSSTPMSDNAGDRMTVCLFARLNQLKRILEAGVDVKAGSGRIEANGWVLVPKGDR